MGQALNTTVNGSSGTCVAVADWLSRLYGAAHHGDDAVRQARSRAEAGWQGPAHDEFVDALDGLPAELGELADRSYEAEWALRAFADSLDKVVDTMGEALSLARTGCLRVDGPFIVAPMAPVEPAAVTGKCSPGMSAQKVAELREAADGYRVAAADYNGKAEIYNRCKALVEDARRLEEKAHHELRAKMETITDVSTNWVTIGAMATSRALGSLTGLQNGRRALVNTTERLLNEAKFLTNWANGTVSSVNPLQQRVLELAQQKARNATAYKARVSQFEKWASTVPQSARELVTSHPGATLPSGATGALKALPYLGSSLVVVNEAYGAYKGEQSWGKAAADSAATIGGSALGAAGATAGGAALMGAPLGPVGSVVAGTVGGVAGAIGGQAVADFFVPG
jgi:hypothetical protein